LIKERCLERKFAIETICVDVSMSMTTSASENALARALVEIPTPQQRSRTLAFSLLTIMES
jgi:hypothetical protein